MNIRDIMQEKVSLFKSADQFPPTPVKNITIKEALSICLKNASLTQKARQLHATNKDKYSDFKKSNIPCVTFSASFQEGVKRSNKTVDKETQTIVLDIDHLSEIGKTTTELKQFLINTYPSIYWAQESLSGDGVFALVYLAKTVNKKKVFAWFKRDLAKYGIMLDKLDDIGRLRFLAWDPKPAYKEEVLACINEYEEEDIKMFEHPLSAYCQARLDLKQANSSFDATSYTKQCIEALLSCPSWYMQDSVRSYHCLHYVACAFKHFPEGEQWFRTLVNKPGYHSRSEQVIQQMWKSANISEVSIDDVHRRFQGAYKRFIKNTK